MSAPRSSGRCSIGVQKQLSTTSSAPCVVRHLRERGDIGDFGERIRRRFQEQHARIRPDRPFPCGTSVAETNVVSTPKRFRMLLNSCTVAPKTLCEATMWSPAFSSPITQARIADMPEAVATQHSAPSSAARRSWNARPSGLVKREYTMPGSSPEKRAAAWAAFLNTKLEVRYSASECSLNWLRWMPARTASVSNSSSSHLIALSSCNIDVVMTNKKPAKAFAKRVRVSTRALAVFVTRPQAVVKSARSQHATPGPPKLSIAVPAVHGKPIRLVARFRSSWVMLAFALGQLGVVARSPRRRPGIPGVTSPVM